MKEDDNRYDNECYDNEYYDNEYDDNEDKDEVSEFRGVERTDTTPCYTKWSWSGGQTIAAKKTGELGSQNSFCFLNSAISLPPHNQFNKS